MALIALLVSQGTTAVLVLAIENETIVCKATGAASAPAAVAALLPQGEPCYCVYRWEHAREGASAAPSLFVYFCPEEAPVRVPPSASDCLRLPPIASELPPIASDCLRLPPITS